jgi:hypothetical protein
MSLASRHDDELTIIQTENRAPGIPIPAPRDPAVRACWEAGVAARKAAGLGTSIGDYE